MQDTITVLVAALSARAWYPLAAALVTCVIQVLKLVTPTTWERLPRRWQWVPAVLLATLGAFAEAASAGEHWGTAVALAVYGGITIGLASLGILHAGKRLGGG
jgi:hypothetical protein